MLAGCENNEEELRGSLNEVTRSFYTPLYVAASRAF